MERFFDLATGPGIESGFIGFITASQFSKKKFGKSLVENFVPRWDITHVVDTSRTDIPGHGTSTVVILARNRPPAGESLRAVMAKAKGAAWDSVVGLIDEPGAENKFVTVSDAPRSGFHKHPWSIGGGGASELKSLIDQSGASRLRDIATAIGFMAITGEDEAYVRESSICWSRCAVHPSVISTFVEGDVVRDWMINSNLSCVFSYDGTNFVSRHFPTQLFWPLRSVLERNIYFGKSKSQRGLDWREFAIVVKDKFKAPLSIAFAFVATHNHFVLDRGGKVFKQTAPVIKLPPEATDEEHLGLLGLLNSSVVGFWLKQVCQPKGGDSPKSTGVETAKPLWDERYEFDCSNVGDIPISACSPIRIATQLDRCATNMREAMPDCLLRTEPFSGCVDLISAKEGAHVLSCRQVVLQEELDWHCYSLYSLTDHDLTYGSAEPPPIELGQRAFEIILARMIAAGEVTTTWFERHNSTPITEIPAHWPDSYRQLVERRIREIEENPNINLIERPEYKRRWNSEPWEVLEERALRSWLLDRLEDTRYWSDIALTTTARLADLARQDADFMQVAEIYRKRSDFDVAALVAELVADEAVPFLPVLRYKDTGLRKRADWEATWELQRGEDRIDARTALPEGHPDRLTEAAAKALKATEIGDIPVPPKYASADFRSSVFWRHRGKLDVPKERFVSYPHCSRDADPSLVIAWAGWDHLQLGRALATYHERTKNDDGWTGQRRVPLLAGILELVPWIRQWHNDPDPDTGERMGDYLAGYVDDETRAIGLTPDDLRRWQPPATTARRGRRAKG